MVRACSHLDGQEIDAVDDAAVGNRECCRRHRVGVHSGQGKSRCSDSSRGHVDAADLLSVDVEDGTVDDVRLNGTSVPARYIRTYCHAHRAIPTSCTGGPAWARSFLASCNGPHGITYDFPVFLLKEMNLRKYVVMYRADVDDPNDVVVMMPCADAP